MRWDLLDCNENNTPTCIYSVLTSEGTRIAREQKGILSKANFRIILILWNVSDNPYFFIKNQYGAQLFENHLENHGEHKRFSTVQYGATRRKGLTLASQDINIFRKYKWWWLYSKSPILMITPYLNIMHCGIQFTWEQNCYFFIDNE